MEFIKEIIRLGFKSEEEFNTLINKVDLSSNEKIKEFREWQHNDGTKKGLIELIAGKKINKVDKIFFNYFKRNYHR